MPTENTRSGSAVLLHDLLGLPSIEEKVTYLTILIASGEPLETVAEVLRQYNLQCHDGLLLYTRFLLRDHGHRFLGIFSRLFEESTNLKCARKNCARDRMANSIWCFNDQDYTLEGTCDNLPSIVDDPQLDPQPPLVLADRHRAQLLNGLTSATEETLREVAEINRRNELAEKR